MRASIVYAAVHRRTRDRVAIKAYQLSKLPAEDFRSVRADQLRDLSC